MYKKILKIIKDREIKKSELLDILHKNDQGAIRSQKPHFIFSAENPLYPAKLKMSHEETIGFLNDRGYKTESIQGKYGDHEKSILVHNPPKHAIKHLMKLSGGLGQESSIYSDGYNHELHYHHGDNAGTHHKGQGTNFHKQPPKDNFSTLSDGTTFTHNFDFDATHDRSKSMVKQSPEFLKKSESNSRVYLAKAEQDHPLTYAGPETKLIHYSPTGDLEMLDPHRQGTGIKGTDFRQGKPEHPMTWFYTEGAQPEDIVTNVAKHKYVSSLGSKKLYDVGLDPDNIRGDLKEKAKNRQINPGQVYREDLHRAIKENGYHGLYNSQAEQGMDNVVGMFEKMHIDESHPIHPNDYKEASSKNHHANDASLKAAKNFAKENGHHNYKFLHGLTEEDNG